MRNKLIALILGFILFVIPYCAFAKQPAGSWDQFRSAVWPDGTTQTLSGHATFTKNDIGQTGRHIFFVDPGGANRNYNPSGDFLDITILTIINTADAAETITFDSTGIAVGINQNGWGKFAYNGSEWIAIGSGTSVDIALTADGDFGDFDIHSIDGLYGIDDQVYIDMGTNSYLDAGADGGIRLTSPFLSLTTDDPYLYFDPSTASESEYWLGVNHDSAGDDNDAFELRQSATPGSSVLISTATSSGNTTFTGDITVNGGNINTGNIPLTIGDGTTDTITLNCDGTGNAEVVLPNDSVGDDEIDWAGASGTKPIGTSETLSDNGTFTPTDVGDSNQRTFHIDPGGSNRNYNPSGTFNTWTIVKIVNIADAAETITFDSEDIAEAIDQGESGEFQYNGSSWVKTDATSAPGVIVEDTAYSSGFNGDSSHAPSQNAMYDYLHQIDTDDDGDIDNPDSNMQLGTINLSPLASAPSSPGAGQTYFADNDNWDPANISGVINYYNIYDGANYIANFDEDGALHANSFELTTLKASELNDTSDPHTLTEVELKTKILTNSESTGADEWDFPARGEGWSFKFTKEADYDVALDPNSTENYWFRDDPTAAYAQVGAGIAIENVTDGKSEINGYSTESGVYLTGDNNWSCPLCEDFAAYLFCYDGNYSGDTDKAYFGSGASTKDGTTNNVDFGTSYGLTGCSGVFLDADADYIQWTVAARDGFNEAAFTILILSKPISSAGGGGDLLFASQDDANNFIKVTFSDDNTVRVNYTGQSNEVICTSTNTYIDNEWQWTGIAGSVAGNVLSVNIDGQGWEDDGDATAMAAFAATSDYNLLGNLVSGIDDSHNVALVIVSDVYEDPALTSVIGW